MTTEKSGVYRPGKGPDDFDETEKLLAELPVDDEVPSAEVTTFGVGKRLLFDSFAALLQLVRWEWKGDELLLEFDFKKRVKTPWRKKALLIRTFLAKVHLVDFSHFYLKFDPVHRAPFAVKRFFGFKFKGDNTILTYWKVLQWNAQPDEDKIFVPVNSYGIWDPGVNDEEFKCTFLLKTDMLDNGFPPKK
jgi:hypothetical protein